MVPSGERPPAEPARSSGGPTSIASWMRASHPNGGITGGLVHAHINRRLLYCLLLCCGRINLIHKYIRVRCWMNSHSRRYVFIYCMHPPAVYHIYPQERSGPYAVVGQSADGSPGESQSASGGTGGSSRRRGLGRMSVCMCVAAACASDVCILSECHRCVEYLCFPCDRGHGLCLSCNSPARSPFSRWSA